jgi:hypothetical protein
LPNRPPILGALLFLAPHQVLAQRFGQLCFAGSPLDAFPRGDPGRLAHLAMQQERREPVKKSLLIEADFPRGWNDYGTTRRDDIRACTRRFPQSIDLLALPAAGTSGITLRSRLGPNSWAGRLP